MAHIIVPHTIQRRETYYFNIRLNDQCVRLSLGTKSSRLALTVVSRILELMRIRMRAQKMNLEEIKEIVNTAKNTVIYNAKAILEPDSKEAKALNKEYSAYQSKLLVQHNGYSNSHGAVGYDVPEPEPIKSVHQFKLDKFPSSEFDSNQKAKKLLTSKMKLRDNPDYLQVITSEEYIRGDEELTILYKDAKQLRSLIEEGKRTEAYKLLDLIMGINTLESKSNPSDEKKDLNTFESYVNEFLEAGVKGTLPSNGKSAKSTRPAWSPNIYKGHRYTFTVFNYVLGNEFLNNVSAKMLDGCFAEVIFNLPKGNLAPYNQMTIEQRIESAVNGSVDDEDVIAGKTAKEYFKSLQSLYAWLHYKHIINSSEIKNMRTKISDIGRRRGALNKTQVRKLVEYCILEQDVNQKWPVIIMSLTGMRNGEVMQLRTQDVKTCPETNIVYFHITPRAGSVKTESSNRLVPLHSKLLELGFMEQINGIPEGQLFKRDSKFLTRFYANTLKVKCDIPDQTEYEEPLSIYSLRHFFITSLQGENVNPSLTQQLVGHRKSSSITDKQYTHSFSLNQLKDAIEKIKP